MTQSAAPTYRRVLLKLSGEAFGNPQTRESLCPEGILRVAQQLAKVRELGTELAVVVGGGNIFRGAMGVNVGIGRTTGDHMGMLATVINSLALQAALEQLGIETRVMTAIAIPAVAEPFIRRRAIRHLEKGLVVIFSAGTGNPYFTTDSAAALRASEMEADALLKGTKVDGVYDKDPMKHPDAVRYTDLTYDEAIQKRLRIMDTTAFSLCQEKCIPIVVFDFFKDDEMIRVVRGEPAGTLVHEA